MNTVSVPNSRVVLFVGIALLVCASLVGAQPAYASCSSPANAIEAENCLPGNPPSDWQIIGSGDPTIQGFATDISVNAGQTIHFKIKTDASNYVVEIYRMGYYGGLGARRIAVFTPSAQLPQAQPSCLTDNSTFLIDCGNWAVSASWQVPTSATSGLYFAHLLRNDTGGDSHVFFVVRNDASTSPILYQTSDLTWQAYNDYGGHSLYGDASEFNIPVRGLKVSYNRPSDTRSFEAATFLFNAEYPMIRWLEANGFDVSYFTGVDAVRNSGLILNHKVYMSSGHDEYWDGTQRANIKAARDAGMNLAFFSGNEMFWKTRWENSIDGTNTPYRTLVCYKESYGDAVDPLDPPIWTGTWRDPTKSPPADGGQPENAITGTLFMVNGPGADNANLSIKVPQADGQMRFWRNTSIANLTANQVATMPPGTLGYEWDIDPENSVRPAGLFYLSTATYTLTSDYMLDYGVVYGAGTATHHATLYRAPSGALVFGSGTVQWAWGLDSNHDGTITPAPDPNMQQATVNLFADMGVQPATLQSGLQLASQSTDTIAPVSTITSSVSGTTVNVGTPVVIAGTATDAGGGVVAGVEVSTDGGQTWHPAVGRENWTYSWMPSVVGTAALMSRAVDDSANLENPQTSGGNPMGGVTVNVNPQVCPCSIWNPSIAPTTVDGGDPSAIEVGVRFRTDNDGVITGLRFYKASANKGTHIGHLWTGSGTLLGTVTFTGESGSGWQQVQFAAPIAVTANTVYVASYFAPSGHYSADPRYFKGAGYDAPPMHGLEDGISGSNGVFIYTPTPSVFPTASYASTNYWVDVVFVSGTTFEISGNIGGIGGMGATVTLSGAANATTTTDSAGNYQFTGLVNGTYTVSPSNPGVTFSPATQTVTLNSLSLSNVNFGSVVTTPLSISGTITGGGGAGTVVNLSGVTSLFTTADSSGHYSFNGLIAGTYTVTPMQAGYIYTPNSQAVTLASFSDTAVNFTAQPCPCITIWQPTAAPNVTDSGDPAGVEVGVKFRADVAGTIQGLRFYKAVKNTGTHIGHIWSNTGLLLGTATFTNESASGWQEVIFNPPVQVSGNAVYVASYFAPVGHYAFDVSYFQSAGVDNPPLHALANGISGPNGVYSYGNSPLFPNNGFNGTNYWVDLVFAPSPPHNVSGMIAGAGGPGATVTLAGGTTVSTVADASGTFSFPNTYDGTYVLSVSQTGYAFTSSSQTVTVSGSDANGLMFATLPNCLPCDSIWQITAAPTLADAGDPLSVNVGVKFRSDSDGEIAGLRFYKSALNTGTHVGTLWSSSGRLLGSVTFEDESQFGWQQAVFPSPIPITANTTYVVAYLAPSGHYAADANFFSTNGTDSPPLHALANGVDGQNGVFGYGSTILFPNSSYQANNYWVDVIFTPTGSTHAVSGTISGAGGPGATVTLGGAASGTVTADASGNFSFGGLADGGYTVTPSQTGYAFSPGVQPVTVTGADVSGVNFGTVQNCPCDTIWPPSAVPTVADGGDNVSVNLGIKFQADNDGYIVGLRFYKSPLNTGVHIGTLWSSSGTQLATATFTGESDSGWQQVLFDTAVPVTANTTYIASYLAPVGHYASDANYFANNGVDNPPLHALMNGVDGGDAVFIYSPTANFPNQSYQSANYWVDVIYAGTESYSLAGAIGGPGGPGATLILSGASATTTVADASGNYSFGGLGNGSYTVTPVSNIYTFSPSSQSVTLNNSHVLNVNFTSGYGISGNINGPGGPGATVTLTGTASATTIADNSGNYSFTGLPNGTYTISANNSGYVFTPASRAATLNGASASGLNFTTVVQTYTVSGNIGGPGGPGATVSLTGPSAATTTADGLGNYGFAGLVNGTYNLTANLAGYVFTPASQSVTISAGNAVANFASAFQTYSITGTISGPGGAGATVNLTGSSTATTTADASGNYSIAGLLNGSYTVTPTNTGYAFGPASQAVTISSSSATANFTSTLLTFTISGTVSGPGGAGATVNLTGTFAATTTADSSGNFSFSGLLNGPYSITPVNSGYIFTPVSQIVVVNSSNFTGLSFATVNGCPTCNTIWQPTAVPITADSGDATAAELGVKFRADSDGYITGLRFYKATSNTGTHIGNLWTSAGTLLGSATFTNEGVTGWQQVLFATPIPVIANTTYVASYFAPAGHYAGDASFFANAGVDNPPLHALADGLDGADGVYLYSPTGGFPTATLQSTNYWVDVIFNTGQGYSIVGTISGPGAAGATVSLTGTSTATTTTDASGNYSFSSLANGTYTVTPANAGYAFTPGTQSVTISGAHAMNVNFSSVLQAFTISGTISGPGGVGATVNLSGGSTATTTADASGNYTFTGVTNGSYTVTPGNTGFAFTPVSQAVTIIGSNATVNFSSVQVFSLGGIITGPGGPGATVNLTGAATATTTADGSGNYSFTGLLNGSYTVTPSQAGFVYTPSNQAVTISGANATVNFSSAQLFSLGGTISGPGGPGATVNLTGASAATTTADGSGNYSFSGLLNGSYTVTPVKSGYAFSPPAQSVTISGSNLTAVNFNSSVTVASVVLSPASVIGGSTSTGTVTLTGPAPTGGAVVALSSGNTAVAQVPASVTVAANATTATFTVTTSPVATNTSLSISATFGTTQSASLTVTRPVLTSISLNPSSVPSGATSTGTITLSGPAPAGGAVVTLSSTNPAAAQVPASVTVAANASTATFTVTTSSVAANTSLTISGTYGATQSASFTVLSGVLSTVTLNPTSVIGGTSSTGTVTLTKAAPTGGAVVVLSSSNIAAAQVPASVTVAANATTATFTVTTTPVASNTPLTITGVYGATKAASFTVSAPTVNAVSVSPASVVGGTSSTGTVTLNGRAPAGGAVVTLSSSNTAAVQVPATVTVAANTTSITFTATTSPVASSTPSTISAIYGTTRTTTLTVTPPTLTNVTVSPASVLGGTSSTGTVTLNARAPAGGAVVTLSSSNTAAAQVPATVTVAANTTSITFTATTSPVASSTPSTISAIYGTTRTTTLTVTPPTLTSVTVSPTSVLGGTSSTGTVTLNGRAPAGGAVVTLSSSNTAAVQVPANVTVPANTTSVTFTATTSPVGSSTPSTISGIYGTTRTTTLTVVAAALTSFSLNPTSVIGGTSSTGTVTLTGPAPAGGAVVALSSNNTAAAQVPASVRVAAGTTTATFTVTTSPVVANSTPTISTTYNGTKTASLTVTAPTVSALTLNPTTVQGLSPSIGTVTISGPAPTGGTVVSLSSSFTPAATVPANVTVAPGATSATFTVTTKKVTISTTATISATKGVTATARLTVTP